MRRAVALGLALVLAAAATAAGKISTQGGEVLASGTTTAGLEFRFVAVRFANAANGPALCVVVDGRHRIAPRRRSWVGVFDCDRPGGRPWHVHASWGGNCGSRAASVVGFVHAPAVRVKWRDGQVADATVLPVPDRFARSSVFGARLAAPDLAGQERYSLFFANAATRSGPRRIQALDASGAVVARIRYPRRATRWVCKGYPGFYLGRPRAG